MLLEVENAVVHYGKVQALKSVSLGVPPGGTVPEPAAPALALMALAAAGLARRRSSH